MRFVTEEIAEQFATEEWPIERIKAAHDGDVHWDPFQDLYSQCLGCPSCKHCRCPVPIELHTSKLYL